MAKHDENKDLKSLARIAKVDYATKTIKQTHGVVGIHTWGKIDYLVKYCGWFFQGLKNVITSEGLVDYSENKKAAKAEKKVKKIKTNKQ